MSQLVLCSHTHLITNGLRSDDNFYQNISTCTSHSSTTASEHQCISASVHQCISACHNCTFTLVIEIERQTKISSSKGVVVASMFGCYQTSGNCMNFQIMIIIN